MAVVRIREQWPKRSGGVRINSERTYRRYFRVKTDSDYDAAGVIMDTFALYAYSKEPFENDDGTYQTFVPWIGSEYQNTNPDPIAGPPDPVPPDEDDGDVDGGDEMPEAVNKEGDRQALCVDVDFNQLEEDSRWWDGVFLYTNRPEKDPEEFGADPTQRRVECKWGSQTYEQYLQHDFTIPNVRTLINSAGDPFEGFKTEYSYRVLTLTRWEKTGHGGWDPVASIALENTVNKATWCGFGPRQVKCKSITADLSWECGALYWHVTYTFHIRDDPPWDFRPLDAGFRYLDGSGNIKDYLVKGSKPSQPVLLDGSGHLLNGDGRPGHPNAPVYWDGSGSLLPYLVFAEEDFNTTIVPPLSLPA